MRLLLQAVAVSRTLAAPAWADLVQRRHTPLALGGDSRWVAWPSSHLPRLPLGGDHEIDALSTPVSDPDPHPAHPHRAWRGDPPAPAQRARGPTPSDRR